MSQNVTFSANQLAFVEWLATTKDERQPSTQEALAEQLDIHPRTLIRWKKIPEIRKAATERARELLGDDLPEIYAALTREAKAGSYQHIKLSLAVSGEYIEGKTLDITSGGKPLDQLFNGALSKAYDNDDSDETD